MVFSPNLLKSSFNLFGEPAKACYYVCFITPPTGLLTGGILSSVIGVAGSLQVSLMAESCSIPGKALATTPFTMYGTTMKMPYGVLYNDFQANFICTNSMVERSFFELWMSYVNNSSTNYLNYLDDYRGSVIVVKLNNSSIKDEAPQVTALRTTNIWMLQEAYPIQMADQNLGYDITDEYMRLNVQFAYRKYTCGMDSLGKLILPGPPGSKIGVTDLSTYSDLAIQLITQGLAGGI